MSSLADAPDNTRFLSSPRIIRQGRTSQETTSLSRHFAGDVGGHLSPMKSLPITHSRRRIR